MRHLCLLLLLVLWPAPLPVVRADPPGVSTNREGARVLPLPREEGVFHFAVFGDRTGGPPEGLDVLAQAVRDTNLLGPDLVLTVGDLVNGYNATPDWLEQMRAYRAVIGELDAPWFPVAGNHDVTWGRGRAPRGHHERDYETHFGPLWYWFGHKNAAFVVLYSDEGDRANNRKGWGGPSVNRFSDAQLAWLSETLEATKDRDHVFVFLHHPRWIERYYRGSNWDEVHRRLVAAGNVTAVFAGHIHRRRYDGKRDGIEYFTLATTGGGLPFESAGTGYLHHLNVVSVRARGITVATIPVGSVLDPREMTPERWKDVDALRSLDPTPAPGAALALAPDGSARGTSTLRIENPTSRPIEVTATLADADAGWSFDADHRHRQVAPGETWPLEIRYARDAEAGLPTLRFPRLLLAIDYLAETSRVSIPERSLPFPWRLTALPATAAEPGRGGVLYLPGGSACLEVAPRGARLPDGPFTIEAWVKAETYAGRRGLLAKTENSEYGLFVSDARPSFSVFLGGAYRTASVLKPVLAPGRWHHVAGVYDGAELRLYVDGRRTATAAASGPRRTNGLPLFVGADPDGHGRPTSGLRGRIDEVRVSTAARYEGKTFEPAPRHTPDDATFLLLHLDAGLGPIAPDHGPGARHALARGEPSYEAGHAGDE